MRGPASDIEIEAAQIMAARERIDRNLWMTAREAQAYGLVHRVIERALDV